MDATPEALVFVVDDDQAVGEFVCRLIKSVGLQCRTYQTAQAFLDDAEFDCPGCLVLDIRMPGMSGLELQQELARRQVLLPTIMLTGHGNVQVAVHAMKAGAVDFIEKPFNNEILLARIQHAVGRSVAQYRENRERIDVLRRMDSLSNREHQVLDMVVEGLTNRVMAERLNVSEKTIEHYRARMMEKMDAGNLPELVTMVSRSGEMRT